MTVKGYFVIFRKPITLKIINSNNDQIKHVFYEAKRLERKFHMEIYKVKDYKKFADDLRNKTGCDVKINIIGKDHTHYQLDKMGLSLGVLCVNKGEVSFAPFETHETAKNDQYINVQYFPLLDDFVELLAAFREMFVSEDVSV